MRLSLLALSAALILQPAFADNISDLQKYLADTKTLAASFNQVVRNKNGKQEQSSGQFALQRPGKFKWSYSKPYQQDIISNGQSVWLYDVDLAQVTIKPIGKALDASPAAILTGSNNLAASYQLQNLPTRGGAEWVALTPKSKDGSFAQIRLGMVKGQLERMELDDHFNQTTTISLQQIQRNGGLNPAQFTFTPPAGTDIIRE
ncbi:outer membrane lipoprotein chaperone LolA [Chitinibacter tainanensis]|uniref:outer membrane lipoprotein chaperone LolA n=1 Tax=Chitinibacter tainanensis TaxID=230667 RepID=UPI002357E708|nr:outer membrane lipoprotein chaperone LolA [Chitinibacter tainanensis]